MLKKLIKYDLKKMFWAMGYIHVFALLFSAIARIINIGSQIQILFMLGLIFSSVACGALGFILVFTFVQILKVFYKNFYKDESYLTHTLPVSKNKLLLSKYLSAIVMILINFLVVFACFSVLTSGKNFKQFMEIFGLLFEFVSYLYDISKGVVITLFSLNIIAQICVILCVAFTTIIKANTYNSKRMLKGFLWFAVYYYVAGVLSLAVIAFAFLIMGNINEFFALSFSRSAFLTVLVVGLICRVAEAVTFYFVSQKIFKRGVNVD